MTERGEFSEEQIAALQYADKVRSKVEMCMCGPSDYEDAVDKAVALGIPREVVTIKVSHR